MPYLSYTLQASKQKHPLGTQELIVGRGAEAGLQLPVQGLSRQHFRIFYQAPDYYIQDLASSNGTKLRGKLLPQKKPFKLQDRDQIQASTFSCMFFNDQPETALEPHQEKKPSLKLELIENETISRQVVLTPSELPFRIGRNSNNHLILDHKKVSGYHCEITSHQDGFLLQDLKTPNGTWVSDKKVESIVLQDGDSIEPAHVCKIHVSFEQKSLNQNNKNLKETSLSLDQKPLKTKTTQPAQALEEENQKEQDKESDLPKAPFISTQSKAKLLLTKKTLVAYAFFLLLGWSMAYLLAPSLAPMLFKTQRADKTQEQRFSKGIPLSLPLNRLHDWKVAEPLKNQLELGIDQQRFLNSPPSLFLSHTLTNNNAQPQASILYEPFLDFGDSTQGKIEVHLRGKASEDAFLLLSFKPQTPSHKSNKEYHQSTQGKALACIELAHLNTQKWLQAHFRFNSLQALGKGQLRLSLIGESENLWIGAITIETLNELSSDQIQRYQNSLSQVAPTPNAVMKIQRAKYQNDHNIQKQAPIYLVPEIFISGTGQKHQAIQEPGPQLPSWIFQGSSSESKASNQNKRRYTWKACFDPQDRCTIDLEQSNHPDFSNKGYTIRYSLTSQSQKARGQTKDLQISFQLPKSERICAYQATKFPLLIGSDFSGKVITVEQLDCSGLSLVFKQPVVLIFSSLDDNTRSISIRCSKQEKSSKHSRTIAFSVFENDFIAQRFCEEALGELRDYRISKQYSSALERCSLLLNSKQQLFVFESQYPRSYQILLSQAKRLQEEMLLELEQTWHEAELICSQAEKDKKPETITQARELLSQLLLRYPGQREIHKKAEEKLRSLQNLESQSSE